MQSQEVLGRCNSAIKPEKEQLQEIARDKLKSLVFREVQY